MKVPFHLINGPNLPFPFETPWPLYSTIGFSLSLFSRISLIAESKSISKGDFPPGIDINFLSYLPLF